MVSFAELKAKADKVKDAGVAKMSNTRDRFSSTPTSKSNWDPNWKRAPPPAPSSSSSSSAPVLPLRSRPDVAASNSSLPPPIPSVSRPTEDAPPSYVPPPPPTRASSGYPPSLRRDTFAADRIDWANLSAEDKEVFFAWLDEFFSRYLGIEVGPRSSKGSQASPPPAVAAAASALSSSAAVLGRRVQGAKPPPSVNVLTRPQV